MWLSLQKTMVQKPDPYVYLGIHGQLFWKAKQMLLERRFGKRGESEVRNMVAQLAELPHAARRKGIELEYALEKFALGV